MAGLVTIAAAGCEPADESSSPGHMSTSNLPRSTDRPQHLRVKIELQVPEDDPYGVIIVLNDAENFGQDFERLGAALADLRGRGLPADHPVVISPWMSCDNKWVVKAFDAAVAARFTNIHFAVPYGPKD